MEAERKLTALEEKWQAEKAATRPKLDQAITEDGKIDEVILQTSVLEMVPKPTGWRLAILPYRGNKASKCGILFSDETQKRTQLATNVGYVLRVGDLAYADQTKFPNGPWRLS